MSDNTAVIGAGSWGTAIAKHLAERGVPTTLWAREPEVAEGVRADHQNPLFLSGVALPEQLHATSDLEEAVGEAAIIVSAVPTQFVRSVFEGTTLPKAEVLVSVSKGIEVDTLRTPSEILGEAVPGELGANVVSLSGPSFAAEVAAGHPTAVVAASREPDNARRIRDLVSDDRFRAYSSDDVVSVELGGALKNVMAIAAGTADGLGFGYNTRAALITRGLAEMTRLGVARGGHPLTFAGLSGLGDLVLTCTGDLSRNRQVGLELGRGRTLSDILAGTKEVAEGVKTTAAAQELSTRVEVDMPITNEVYRVLYEDKEPRTAMLDLMRRDLRDERE